MRPLNVLTATLVAASFTVAAAASAGTLEDVKARGVLRCVVSTGIAAGLAVISLWPPRHVAAVAVPSLPAVSRPGQRSV